MENMDIIKLVVADEHTLGYILPNMMVPCVSVLHASILRGATTIESLPLSMFKNIRLANEQDFEDFRVHFSDAYKNEKEYQYQK